MIHFSNERVHQQIFLPFVLFACTQKETLTKMDVFLGKITQQAMNYAIRSGVTITASYAIKQSARLLKVYLACDGKA